MRFRLLLGFALGAFSTLFLAGNIAAAEIRPDAGFPISAAGEFFVLHKYSRLKSHKAIAVGPFGYWDAYYGMRSASAAANTALAACNRHLRADKLKEAREKRCVLFDIDGKRTDKARPIGIPFGTPAPGEDLPWLFGKEWAATSPKKRGTMLLLHGCSGYVLDGWQMAWVSYYRAAGFRVIMPNSFADVRDLDSCGVPKNLVGSERQTRNLKLRIAQTLRTIAGIRRKYPGEALYLHGHSEGGWVAQALGEKLDGIIITGAICGFGYSGVYLAGKGVPILHIVGTKDHAFVEATSSKALKRHCQGVTGAGKVTRVAISGMDHYAPIWRPEVQAAIGKFLNIPIIRLGRSKSDDASFPKIPSINMEAYQQARPHKAIAASKDGYWDWSLNAGNELDAEETALFGCDNAAGADAYLDTEHVHLCTLVDVDGKRPAK